MRSTGSRIRRQRKGGSRLPSFLFRAVSYSQGRLSVIDQRLLPGKVKRVRLRSAAAVSRAIQTLAVRGAPNIGVAAGYGLAVEAHQLGDSRLRPGLELAAGRLLRSRPTAVNLSRAIWRIQQVLGIPGLDADSLRSRVEAEARRIEDEEIESSVLIARIGGQLVKKNAKVLTICNTGALAGPGFGTALGVVFQAQLDGKSPQVYACETRPLLQGARLTALELERAGVRVKLIADSAAASVIQESDLVLVGADRIAANGDTANKVGTRMLAVLAREHGLPFHVVAPSSSFDLSCRTGKEIVIEERDGEELRRVGRCRVCRSSVPVYNPAFDITPARYITSFVTELGVLGRPFGRSFRQNLGTETARAGRKTGSR